MLQDAVALSVLVVVQEAIDIALHIASDEGWEHASSYRDSFMTLERHGLLDAALTARLAGAAQLRHRIAHRYSSLDVDRLWSELPDGHRGFLGICGAGGGVLDEGRGRVGKAVDHALRA